MTVRGKQERVFKTGEEGAALLFTKWPCLICHLNGQYPFLFQRIPTQQIVQHPVYDIKTLYMSGWLLSKGTLCRYYCCYFDIFNNPRRAFLSKPHLSCSMFCHFNLFLWYHVRTHPVKRLIDLILFHSKRSWYCCKNLEQVSFESTLLHLQLYIFPPETFWNLNKSSNWAMPNQFGQVRKMLLEIEGWMFLFISEVHTCKNIARIAKLPYLKSEL